MLKSWKNRPANRWYTALALATALASGTPRTGRAGQLTVTENLPNTGFTKTEILGAGANVPLASGQSYSGPIPSIETGDGRFRFIFNDISAADPNGFPTLTGQMTLVNLVGGQGSLFLDFKQAFVPNPIFNNGCFDATALVGTFTESSVHGNNVVGVGLVGGAALPPLAASDTNGGFFNPQTPYFFLPPPTEYEGLVTFNFAAGSQAGDMITLPFTFSSPSLTALPEPASWVMAITAVVSGLARWAIRRGRATT